MIIEAVYRQEHKRGESMIKNIVFDIGNVLVAFRWREYFAEFGYPQDIYERLAKATALNSAWNEYDLGNLTEEEILQGFIKNDPELEPQIRETLTNLDGLLIMYDYAVDWIKDLKEKGYGVYYLSNYSYAAHRDCEEQLAFLPYTDGGILSYQDHVIKPEPAIYHLLLERYGLKAEECVFLDDTEKNIKGAQAVGMKGIVFQNKAQAVEELRKMGVDA